MGGSSLKSSYTDWDKLKIFYLVARAGSFSAAAEVLNLSQSALSRSVGNLEKQLQTRLFERLHKGLLLTKQGEILFEAVSKIYKDLSHAEFLMQDEENEPTGLLRIATTYGFSISYLSQMISDFLKTYPKLQLSIHGTDKIPSLDSDIADAAVCPFISSGKDLIQTYITSFHPRLYASKNYLKKYGVPQCLEDLNSHKLLAFGDQRTSHPFGGANWHLTTGLKEGAMREPYLMINSAVGLFNLAEDDLGIIAIASEHPELKGSNLVEILPFVPGPSIKAYFVYSNRMRKSKKLKVLKEYLIETFKKSDRA